MKDRTVRWWLSGDYIIVEEREAHGKYVKGMRRKWFTERISLTVEEFRKMTREISTEVGAREGGAK